MRRQTTIAFLALVVASCAQPGPNGPEHAMDWGEETSSVAVSPDQSVIVANNIYSGVVTWDLDNEPVEFRVSPLDVTEALVIDDQHVYIADVHHPVYRVDHRTGEVTELPGGTPTITRDSVVTSDNLVFNRINGDFVLWDPYNPTDVTPIPQSDAINTGEPIERFTITDDYIFITRKLTNGETTEAWDRTDPTATEPTATTGPMGYSSRLVADTANNVYLNPDNTLQIWNPLTGDTTTINTGPPSSRVTIVEDQRYVSVTASGGTVIVDLTTNQIVATHKDFFIDQAHPLDNGRIIIDAIINAGADDRYGQPTYGSLQVWSIDDLLTP